MSPIKGDLAIVKSGLQDRVREVCERLLPQGREEGGQWVSVNPVTGDHKKTPALKIRVRGGEPGAWRDWRSGDAGDVVGLVAYLLTGNTRNVKEALAWGRDLMGLQTLTREERAALHRAEDSRKAEREKADAKRRRWRLQAAAELAGQGVRMAQAGPPLPPEKHARAYFAARNVPLDLMQTLNRETFRFSGSTEWWKGAQWKHEPGGRRHKIAEGPRYPAIHAAMRLWNGEISACHCTFLDPVKAAKAPVDPAKLMFGEALGAVIEISTGWSETPFWQADASQAGPLILAEGIETAMSFAIAQPEARVWAGGSLAGVGGAPVQLDCVEWVLFARDNNTGNRTAQKQFDSALEKLEAHGKRIVVEASHVGDDFNDLATGDE